MNYQTNISRYLITGQKTVNGTFESAENTCAGTYLFGFNGKERDNEGMGGGGSTYDYGFRIYNGQIGKFLSVDPLTREFPYLSPYQFANNTPIKSIDIEGLEQLDANFLIAVKTGKTTIRAVIGIRYDFNANAFTFGIGHGQVGYVTATFDLDKKEIINLAILDNDIGAKDRFNKNAGFKVPAFIAVSSFKSSVQEIDMNEFMSGLETFNKELEGLGFAENSIGIGVITSLMQSIAANIEDGTIETRLLSISSPDVIKSVKNEETGDKELKEFKGGMKIRLFKKDREPISFDGNKILLDAVIDYTNQSEK